MSNLGNCCKLLQCFKVKTDEAVTKVVISNNLTEQFPQICIEHSLELEDICLNSTRISALPPQLFYCQGLRVLSISNNNLESIPNAIGSLRHLEILNASRNFISSLPENLKNCKNLKQLDLSCNSLQRLPDAITCLVGLEELFLNETYLEFLPANFGRLVNLRILELRLNCLISLPKSMSRLENLERIDIGGNEFKELPEVVGDLKKLRELWIDCNEIQRISPNIGNLQELKHFEANGNLIESFPNEVSSWRNVEVFSICTNNMKVLPHNFGMLNMLVTLKCEYCKLMELPDSISSLIQLEELVVSHNQLKKLPSKIGMLRKLRFLFADDNNLQTLPHELCSCTALSLLSVSRNKLNDLPQNIGHLTSLKVLNLVGNCISSLPVCMLSMVNLSSLWLSENQTQPLMNLQYTEVNGETRLTCFMLPQNRAQTEYTCNPKDSKVSSSASAAHASNSTRRICFSTEKSLPYKEEDYSEGGNHVIFISAEEENEPRLMRSPTPYPKELRLMSKYTRFGQKLSQSSPDSMNVKKARIIANNYSGNDTTDNETKNQLKEGTKEAVSFHPPNVLAEVTNICDQQNNFQMQQYNFDNTQRMKMLHRPDYDAKFFNQSSSDANVYSNFYETVSITEDESLSNVNQTVLRSQQQPQQPQKQPHLFSSTAFWSTIPREPLDQREESNRHTASANPATWVQPQRQHQAVQSTFTHELPQNHQQHPHQFVTPPPYHIARSYTKKTLQDLSNYDSMRSRQYIYENEFGKYPTTSQKNTSISEENAKSTLNFDEENNLPQENTEVEERLQPSAQLSQSAKVSYSPAPGNCNSVKEVSHNIKKSSPTYSERKTSWLFGAHKNPTVKQITLREEKEGFAFHIGKKSNEEGVYVLWIAQNTNASRLLRVNDKLLEINGHDFTDIDLEEAERILHNENTLNIMFSRN